MTTQTETKDRLVSQLESRIRHNEDELLVNKSNLEALSLVMKRIQEAVTRDQSWLGIRDTRLKARLI